jgi:predicted nucleic acid-binding protein
VIFLLDTTTFSDLMRDDPRVAGKLAGIAAIDRAVICSIIRGEVRHGIERLPAGKRRESLEAKAMRLSAAIPCEPVLPTAGDHYGRIKATA